MEAATVKAVREKTGAGMLDVKHCMKKFPKANVEELIEIIRYVGLAVYHKTSVEEQFRHLM